MVLLGMDRKATAWRVLVCFGMQWPAILSARYPWVRWCLVVLGKVRSGSGRKAGKVEVWSCKLGNGEVVFGV